MTHVAGLDTTIQKTNEWLCDIGNGLGLRERPTEYAALRATLHALRDHLPPDEIAHLSAELPIAVRGVYFEGWDPNRDVTRLRNRQAFLAAVRREVQGHQELVDIEKVVRVTLGVLSRRITRGEVTQIVKSLPEDIRELWTQPAS